MKRVAVLASGSGSNSEALVKFFRSNPVYGIDVALLLSDQPKSYCLQRAEKLDVPNLARKPKEFADKKAYEQWIAESLQEWDIEWIVLAGYMRLIGPDLLGAYEGRIVNIHPSLLPSFPGKHAVEQALAAGVQVSGVTIHVVDHGMDTGPILHQQSVPIHQDDSPADLQTRIAQQEHWAYPRVVAAWIHGGVKIVGKRAQWDAAWALKP